MIILARFLDFWKFNLDIQSKSQSLTSFRIKCLGQTQRGFPWRPKPMSSLVKACNIIANWPRPDWSFRKFFVIFYCNVGTEKHWCLQGHDEWCYADTVTLSVTHNHRENTGQEIANRKVNFVQQKTSTQTQHLREWIDSFWHKINSEKLS